jgi:hypothetical protein
MYHSVAIRAAINTIPASPINKDEINIFYLPFLFFFAALQTRNGNRDRGNQSGR